MTLPKYIRRGGDIVMAPPLELRDTIMYSFLVDANLAALTKMLDDQLNVVSAPRGVVYKPLLPMVAVVCASAGDSHSTAPPDSLKGWMGERDFGVWVPVIAGKQDGGTWRPERLCWYLPYVFVDNVAAMATGREVYGFFKELATLAMPPSPSARGMFSIDTLVIPRFLPSSQAEVLRLLTITSTQDAVADDHSWTSLREAADAIWGEVKDLFFDSKNGEGMPISLWDLIKELLEAMVSGDVPLVFLKQFRDVGAQDLACYQAVVEAPAHLLRLHGGWFTKPHDLSFAQFDSHPIVRDCGLAGPNVRSQLGFWVKMDFVMQPGSVVASST